MAGPLPTDPPDCAICRKPIYRDEHVIEHPLGEAHKRCAERRTAVTPIVPLVTAQAKKERDTSEHRDACSAEVFKVLRDSITEATRSKTDGVRPSSVLVAIAFEDGSIFTSAPTGGDRLVLLRGAAGRAIRKLDVAIDEGDYDIDIPATEPEPT